MLRFTKMHGLGNDYVYMDAINQKINNPEILAKFVSNRHFGIGSDGLILICNSNVADFKMRVFNPDGTEAEMCGNGIRCVGKFIYDKKLSNKKKLKIETLSGIKELELFIKDNTVSEVRVDMGEPVLKPSLIPVKSNLFILKNLKLNSNGRDFIFTCVSMGNPHAVTFVDDLDNLDVDKYGEDLHKNSVFPNKSNIEFVNIIDSHNIKMRVYERGVGETFACGSGACASVVACKLNKIISNDVIVHLKGGDLSIDIDNNNHVFMTGEAKAVYDGNLYIDNKILKLKKDN